MWYIMSMSVCTNPKAREKENNDKFGDKIEAIDVHDKHLVQLTG